MAKLKSKKNPYFNPDLENNNRLQDFVFWLLLCILVLFVFTTWLFGCSAISDVEKKAGIEEDNVIEEVVEFVIEKETGIDIDLSPDSPEK